MLLPRCDRVYSRQAAVKAFALYYSGLLTFVENLSVLQGRNFLGADFYALPLLRGSVQERSLYFAKHRVWTLTGHNAVCKVRDGFSSIFSEIRANYEKAHIFAKNQRKNRPPPCKTGRFGSILVVLQSRGTSVAQNLIKMAKRKNRPRESDGPAVL